MIEPGARTLELPLPVWSGTCFFLSLLSWSSGRQFSRWFHPPIQEREFRTSYREVQLFKFSRYALISYIYQQNIWPLSIAFSTVLGIQYWGRQDTRVRYLSLLTTTILGDGCRALRSQHKYDFPVDNSSSSVGLLSVEPSRHQQVFWSKISIVFQLSTLGNSSVGKGTVRPIFS